MGSDLEEEKRQAALAIIDEAMIKAGAALRAVEKKHVLDEYWQNIVKEAREGLLTQEVAAAFFVLGFKESLGKEESSSK